MKRIITLTEKCLNMNEPVLLIGDTGTGKTIICQVLALIRNSNMKIVNCHENLDVSDFIGSMRSVMGKEKKFYDIVDFIKNFLEIITKDNIIIANEKENKKYIKYIAAFNDIKNKIVDDNIQLDLKKIYKISNFFLNKISDNNVLENISKIRKAIDEINKFFEWQDGPITECMIKGGKIINYQRNAFNR